MFHYKPLLPDKQFRLVVAAGVAIMAHVCLFSLTIAPRTKVEPGLSLPQSVNVFLGQKTYSPALEAPNQVVPIKTNKEVPGQDEMKTSDTNVATPSARKAEKEGTAAVPIIKESLPLKKTTVVAKHIIPPQPEPAARQAAVSIKESRPATGKPAFSPLEDIGVKAAETPGLAGVKRPGTLQMAHPRYQLNTPPKYPGLARKRGQEGTVVLQVMVNQEGRVDDLKIESSSGSALLDRAAQKAVRRWIFEPGRRGEERVGMWVKVPVTFKLK